MFDRFFSNDRNVVCTTNGTIVLASSIEENELNSSDLFGTVGNRTESSSADISDSVVDVLGSSANETINSPTSEVSTESTVSIEENSTESSSEVSSEIATEVITEESTSEEISTETSVSSNEIVIGGGTVSVENAIDYTGILQGMSADIKSLKEEPKFFEKPLNDYTVSEGLLLLLVFLLLAIFASKIMRGGERHV